MRLDIGWHRKTFVVCKLAQSILTVNTFIAFSIFSKLLVYAFYLPWSEWIFCYLNVMFEKTNRNLKKVTTHSLMSHLSNFKKQYHHFLWMTYGDSFHMTREQIKLIITFNYALCITWNIRISTMYLYISVTSYLKNA